MNDAKQDLYAGLGHLFYSIAAIDGHVAKAETGKLKKLVKEQWMPAESGQDSAGSDLAYYIEIGFDHANDQHLSPETAFDRFQDVHEEHPDLFDESTRHMILRTAKAIANAFAGGNEAEAEMVERLEEVFG